MILVRKILRKFDTKILQICPPHFSDVATLPWTFQKSQIFSGFVMPKIIKTG